MTISPEETMRIDRETLKAIRQLIYAGEHPSRSRIAKVLGLKGSSSPLIRVRRLIAKGYLRRDALGGISLTDAADPAEFARRVAQGPRGRGDAYHDVNRAIADRLRALRIDRGITDVVLAKAIAVKLVTYQRMEWGLEWVHAGQLAVVARILAVTVDYFTADRYAFAAMAKILHPEEEEQ